MGLEHVERRGRQDVARLERVGIEDRRARHESAGLDVAVAAAPAEHVDQVLPGRDGFGAQRRIGHRDRVDPPVDRARLEPDRRLARGDVVGLDEAVVADEAVLHHGLRRAVVVARRGEPVHVEGAEERFLMRAREHRSGDRVVHDVDPGAVRLDRRGSEGESGNHVEPVAARCRLQGDAVDGEHGFVGPALVADQHVAAGHVLGPAHDLEHRRAGVRRVAVRTVDRRRGVVGAGDGAVVGGRGPVVGTGRGDQGQARQREDQAAQHPHRTTPPEVDLSSRRLPTPGRGPSRSSGPARSRPGTARPPGSCTARRRPRQSPGESRR